ncbi:MAG: histidinol-phosphatase HisJ family protein [Oscillibacter sp.]|uniref:histidinol-phosphatase HisJ family protein n=1 Tax=uncultured Oscillibacter sp. TaxID=876091 RepID=UPI00216DFAAA|nr:histidinol-phosphatase HisJ family protein [uncultured Oscillibacter sp.]MCI9643928.1 histidinol-phosphatase HisJ family protein [Oscillibacter sp.]
MYLADYHVHSRISPDGGDSMAALAEAAIQAGLDELCFTDHVEPIIWASTDLRGPYDWTALAAEFDAARAAVGDRIKLRLGIELGDACWNFAHTEKLLEDAPPLDFIIGSVHMLSERYKGLDLYYFDPETEEEAYGGIADYLGRVKAMAEWGKFDVLGHLTLPLRYLNENRGWNLNMDRFGGEIADIFAILNRKGIGIEVNTNRGNTPLPDGKWLRLYEDMADSPIVTLGTDAHSAEFVGCAVRERQELLRQCGFRQFCTFERRKPAWHGL